MQDNNLTQDLQAQVQAAIADKTPLTIVGGNSKAFYGRQFNADATLAVNQHQGIVAYEPSELAMTVRAGTPLWALEAVLRDNGQIMPFDPPDFDGNATIGGAVAAGLSGPRRPYTGSVRDALLGVKIINGHGQVLEFGGRVMKNVAGYDVSRLMAGAMGTLGVLLEVSFKLRPIPADETTYVWTLDSEQALKQLNAGFRFPLNETASAWDGEKLYLRVSGNADKFSMPLNKIEAETPDIAETFWNDLKNHRLTWFDHAQPLWRISVKPGSPALHLDGKQLFEWGGGLRWLQSDLPATMIRETVQKLGGHATLFRSSTAIDDVFHPLSPVIHQLHQRLKQSLDPSGIFNPGRMYPDL